jgi:hypothetical protein
LVGVVPAKYFVGPCDDGVDYGVELGDLAGGVEVAEPVEGLEGALFVVGEVEAVEFLEGSPAGAEAGVFFEEPIETRGVLVGECVVSS